MLEMICFWHYHGHTVGKSLVNDPKNQTKGRWFFLYSSTWSTMASLNEISEELAHNFARNSSLTSCLLGYQPSRDVKSISSWNFSSVGKEHYNFPFNVEMFSGDQMKPNLEGLSMYWWILDPRTSPMFVEETIGYPSTHRTEEVWDASIGISKTACRDSRPVWRPALQIH